MRISTLILLLFFSNCGFADIEASQCEEPIAFEPEEFMPDRYETDLYRIQSPIQSNGYLNTYVIETEFGDFEAIGDSLLNIRLKEVDALDQLRSVSRTKVFAQALVDAGLSPVNTIIDFSQKPVATLQGIPKGIGNMFTRYVHKTSEGVKSVQKGVSKASESLKGGSEEQEVEDGGSSDDSSNKKGTSERVVTGGVQLTERYFKVSRAERAWHAEFGTDPYTSNEILQSAIKKVAWADRLGRFGLKLTGGLAIAGADIIGDTYDLVWSKDPYALQDHNRAVLEASGADKELIEQFLDDSSLSPSLQTVLIGALEELDGVKGRDRVLEQSLLVTNEVDGQLFLETLLNLVWINENRVSLDRLAGDAPLPVGIDSAGHVYAPLPSDFLYWTCATAEVMAGYDQVVDSGSNKTLLLAGGLSELADESLGRKGWSVEVNSRKLVSDKD